MLRKMFFSVATLIFMLSFARAGGLDEYFNHYNHVFYNGTDIVIGNVRVGNDFYWGRWELQGDLTFRLVDYGKVDNDYVDLVKLCESKGAVEVDRGEIESLGFEDLEGCVRFTKKPDGTYCCDGGNFHRVLGRTKDGTVIKKYRGFDFPRYMRIGVPYNSKFTVIVNGEEHTAYVTLLFEKTYVNGKECIEEIFYYLNGGFVYYFDPVTYQSCSQ